MQAVILAAGNSNRMKPLTSHRPKPMIPLANKPILEHLITECSQAGVHEFVIIVGYQNEVITSYFGDGSQWGVKIFYRLQEKAMGTADAVRMAQGVVSEKFLVMNGDVIVKKEDISQLAKANRITMAVKEVGDVTGLGVVEAYNGLVRHIYEKPEGVVSKLANAGVYLMTEQIFSAISQTPESQRGEYEITHSLEMLIQQDMEIGCQAITSWVNISYPWDLLHANEALLGDIVSYNDGTVEEGAHIHGNCAIGRDTIIRSGSYIVGPVIIGRDCDLGPNCYIRPSTSVADGCRIGAAVELKNSLIMKGTKIPHHSYVGDSVIGENCNLGAGTKIANLRFDNKEVIVAGLHTSRRKLGAILGDRVETGINSCINVGSVIGDGVVIGPGAIASGVIDQGSRVFSRMAPSTVGKQK